MMQCILILQKILYLFEKCLLNYLNKGNSFNVKNRIGKNFLLVERGLKLKIKKKKLYKFCLENFIFKKYLNICKIKKNIYILWFLL